MRQEAARRFLLLLCILLVVAGCTPPGTVPETVKIGLSAPFEGLYRGLGYEALYGVRLAVRQHNEARGPRGRWLVEIVALNDMNDPAEAVLQASVMAVDSGILGVVGGLSASTAAAAGPRYERYGIPFVTPFADPQALGREAGTLAATQLGAATAFVVLGQDAADQAQAAGFEVAFAGSGTVLGRAQPGETSDPATSLGGLGVTPDVVFLVFPPPRAAEWIAGLRRAGYGGVILGGPDARSVLTGRLAGPESDRLYFVSPYAARLDDSELVARYKDLSGGVAPGQVAAWSYAAARDLLAAIDAALQSGESRWRAGTEAALARLRPSRTALELVRIQDGELVSVGDDR